jgi:site-specific DNA-methyltransferase (adenine-specific)
MMRTLDANSVDAVVTDPPYGLSFMGKRWDYDVPAVDVWAEALRVLKPGGHLLSFFGSRTYHRGVCRIEDAGFEIRDCIMWIYGSGFPKSLDVSKAIDKAAGAERETGTPGPYFNLRGASDDSPCFGKGIRSKSTALITAPATPAARQWQGWGTALKPAHEPIVVARKPLDGTVAANVLKWGCGGLNVDGGRVGTDAGWSYPNGRNGSGWHGRESLEANLTEPMKATAGRFPANVIHDGSEDVTRGMGDTARYFYCAKASKRDRDEGCEGIALKRTAKHGGADNDREDLDPVSERFRTSPSRNHHPTVKPTDLMRYLCRLVTPPNGIILDPFMGSGTTGKAAVLEGFQFIGIEREAEYLEIAKARIEHAASHRQTELAL